MSNTKDSKILHPIRRKDSSGKKAEPALTASAKEWAEYYFNTPPTETALERAYRLNESLTKTRVLGEKEGLVNLEELSRWLDDGGGIDTMPCTMDEYYDSTYDHNGYDVQYDRLDIGMRMHYIKES